MIKYIKFGILAACAFAFDRQLKRVDFPTLGNPTIPHCNAMMMFYLLLFFQTDYIRLYFKKSISASRFLIPEAKILNFNEIFKSYGFVIISIPPIYGTNALGMRIPSGV